MPSKLQAGLRAVLVTVAAAAAAAAATAFAAVSPEEAARLKTDLTPFGAEKAGNKAGTIPAWTGGYTTPLQNDKGGGRRPDPFANEKPLFTVSARNMEQYADQLSEGVKALMKKYPDFRIDVYPTHRTASAAVGLRQHFQERHPRQDCGRQRRTAAGRRLWRHSLSHSQERCRSHLQP